MGIAIILIIGIVVLDIVALLWGTDSRDGLDSPEWERRWQWSMAL